MIKSSRMARRKARLYVMQRGLCCRCLKPMYPAFLNVRYSNKSPSKPTLEHMHSALSNKPRPGPVKLAHSECNWLHGRADLLGHRLKGKLDG